MQPNVLETPEFICALYQIKLSDQAIHSDGTIVVYRDAFN